MQFLNSSDAGFEAQFTQLLNAKREDSPDVDDVVAGIIADVRARGDAALLELTAKFDRMDLSADQPTAGLAPLSVYARSGRVDWWMPGMCEMRSLACAMAPDGRIAVTGDCDRRLFVGMVDW